MPFSALTVKVKRDFGAFFFAKHGERLSVLSAKLAFMLNHPPPAGLGAGARCHATDSSNIFGEVMSNYGHL